MMQVTELDVWKSAMDLTQQIYELTEKFPETANAGLSTQLREISVKIPSNIASAASRKYGKESLTYLYKAKDQVYQIETQLHLANRLVYISEDELNHLLEALDTSRRLLFGFIKHYKRSS
jgi:four helix bundle protein